MTKTKQKANYHRHAVLLEQFTHIQYINDEQSLYRLALLFVETLRARNYAKRPIVGRELALHEFIDWCGARNLHFPAQISKAVGNTYQRQLSRRYTQLGTPLSFGSQAQKLSVLKQWFRWLSQENYIDQDPLASIALPRVPKSLPRHILSVDDIERIFNGCDLNDPLGLRDRAIMELFYSSGIRRAELSAVKLVDINLEQGLLWVRCGKMMKDRLVPIGSRAVAWVRKYLEEARPELECNRDDKELFLSAYGLKFVADNISVMVKRYLEKAHMKGYGSCHLFRHAMATHMLDNGASVRHIQAMLGHADLSTTQVYTQVSVKKLKEVHQLTHPIANLVRKHHADLNDEAAEAWELELTLGLEASVEAEWSDIDTR
jgi:integrase/recombinase XerD